VINPTFEQARSLLIRWGYNPVAGLGGEALGGRIWRCADTSHDVLMLDQGHSSFADNMATLMGELAIRYTLSAPDIRRIMAAEPGGTPTPPGVPPMQHLGGIHLEPQPLTDWGDLEDHATATIVMDKRGRDRLIAALIEGRNSIDVYGQTGGGYQLIFEVKN
jgi:hypothetical protein